jgi:hypothetical protein
LKGPLLHSPAVASFSAQSPFASTMSPVAVMRQARRLAGREEVALVEVAAVDGARRGHRRRGEGRRLLDDVVERGDQRILQLVAVLHVVEDAVA